MEPIYQSSNISIFEDRIVLNNGHSIAVSDIDSYGWDTDNPSPELDLPCIFLKDGTKIHNYNVMLPKDLNALKRFLKSKNIPIYSFYESFKRKPRFDFIVYAVLGILLAMILLYFLKR